MFNRFPLVGFLRKKFSSAEDCAESWTSLFNLCPASRNKFYKINDCMAE